MDSAIRLDPLEAFIQWNGGGFTSAFGHAIGRVHLCIRVFLFTGIQSHLIPVQSGSAKRRVWLCQALNSLQLFDLRVITYIVT